MTFPGGISLPATGSPATSAWADQAGAILNGLQSVPILEAQNTTSSPISIPNNSFTNLSWDTFGYDPANGHSGTTGFVFAVAGYYEVFCSVSFAANATGRRLIAPAFSGSASVIGASQAEGWCNTSAGFVLGRFLVLAAATSGITMQAFQNSGGSLNSSSLIANGWSIRWVHS